MPKYQVAGTVRYDFDVEVEADSPEEASEIATQYPPDLLDGAMEDIDVWDVVELDD